MHAVEATQFRSCSLALHCSQGHAGLETCVMVHAFLYVLIFSNLQTIKSQIVATATVRSRGAA
jgi:hypothetical protein